MKSRRVSTDGESESDSVRAGTDGQSSVVPSFLAPTKAFKVQSVIRTAKQVDNHMIILLINNYRKRIERYRYQRKSYWLRKKRREKRLLLYEENSKNNIEKS